LVELARVAYEEIKLADPQACVLSPSFHSSGNWTEKFDRFLEAGGGKYFDVVSQHLYFDEEPERVVPIIHAFRQVLTKHGLNNIPFWNTEVGWPFQERLNQWPGLSLEELVYSTMLRTYLLNASEGISRVYWYAWDNNGMGVYDPKSKFNYGSNASKAAVHLLDGLVNSNCQPAGKLWVCKVLTKNRHFNVVWLAGRNQQPVSLLIKRKATRWGASIEIFPAGMEVKIDARPVIVEDE
jgi:hypothetical protein